MTERERITSDEVRTTPLWHDVEWFRTLSDQMDADALRLDKATTEAQSAGNALYGEIVRVLEPLFEPNTRELEWDVLPSTIQSLRERLQALEARLKGIHPDTDLGTVMESLLQAERAAVHAGRPEGEWLADSIRALEAERDEARLLMSRKTVALAEARASITRIEANRNRLRKAVTLAIVNLDCERNGMTPDGNLRKRLVTGLAASREE